MEQTTNILINENAIAQFNNEYANYYAIPYPIHSINFQIRDQDHLAQISDYANSFINFLKRETDSVLNLECKSYIIEDIEELDLTRHAFTLHLPNTYYDSLSELSNILKKATKDFIESDEYWLYNTLTCHITNEGNEELTKQDLYAFITMYIYY